MNRRRFLAAAGGWTLALPGCLGQAAPSNQSTTATPSSTTSALTGTGSYVEVPTCPERPDSFTSESALAFAIEFEEAIVERDVLQRYERVVSIDVDTVDVLVEESATRTDGGWLVRFAVRGPAYRYYPDPNATETRHSDPPVYAANYFITDQTVLRAQAIEAVDPRENGVEVSCPRAELE
ncbi:hypothetical protein [Haloarchaeobius sp. HRN-SO-5]|uniref:hypothetical protein n=1 Tax=Haloarchaeobius sp. HRN-SO-5 TaxID=3446118 RepID=UPI003EB7F566